jgi:pyruvate dehydrogenase E2 component (dihydrolipoamide acetyltransferase)
MADFLLPDLGEDIDEADVLKVLVAPGDRVEIDQPVLEIETEKATLEVPSGVAGTVTEILVSPGDLIHPGQALLTVDAAGGSASSASPSAAEPASEPQQESESEPEPEPEPEAEAEDEPVSEPEPEPEPAAAEEPAASEEPAAAEEPAASEERSKPEAEPIDEEETSEESEPAAAPAPPPRVSADGALFAPPSVRKFAREIGVDLASVTGTGPGGRISEDDVKRYARQLAAIPAPQPATERERRPLPDFTQFGEVHREPLSRLRRTVARNMSASWEEIPHVILHRAADITAMEALRQQYKQRARDAGGNLTISVFLLKILAGALNANPEMNASLDTETHEVVFKHYTNIGVAVDTDRGLVVPVIRNVDEKNIIELSIELNEVAERARNNKLTLDDSRGGTFTLTNLGSLGTGYFAPIINPPEVGVLGLGRAQQTPVLNEEGVWEPRLMMPMSLGHDHRLIDGADGARFMQWIVDAIDNPLLLAIEG